MNVNDTLWLHSVSFFEVLLNEWKHLGLVVAHQLHQLLRSCCVVALMGTDLLLLIQLWVLKHSFNYVELVSALVGPHLKLLVEESLILALNNQRIGFVVLLDDFAGFGRHGHQEKLIKSLKILIVFL